MLKQLGNGELSAEGGMMNIRIIMLSAALLLCMCFAVSSLHAQAICSTHDQAVGFKAEKILSEFISMAKSDPKGLKKYLDGLVSKNQAFILKGVSKVKVLDRKKGEDPAVDTVKVQSTKDNTVFWVPGGALDCE
jgi:hypothetical protein